MIDIEQSVTDKFPGFAATPSLIKTPALQVLRKLIHEQEINAFLKEHGDYTSFEFIDRIFDYFNFSYSTSNRSRNNIPAQGRVVIIANHPIGSLDGLALLRQISEVRRDVKVVANDMLNTFDALQNLFLPLDNMKGGGTRKSYKSIMQSLSDEQAVIIFPAGEVSRVSPTGIKDGKWRAGFLHFARKSRAPILPIFIEAKNSLLFYSASMLFKPLGTALLAREMFNKHSAEIRFRIGELIPEHAIDSAQDARNLSDKALVRRLKKHLYKLAKHRPEIFVTEKTIAHPEDRRDLKADLKSAAKLGATRDNMQILLAEHHDDSALMREIGRARELSFRLVGEGTGLNRDLDRFDYYYKHLILWDEERLDIAGSYRLGVARDIIHKIGVKGMYTAELFNFKPGMNKYWDQAVELGRSFVGPSYWGKASLDYLWQGIGAFINYKAQQGEPVRYLIGPVSISADYPHELKEMLVFYYRKYYSSHEQLASAKRPFVIGRVREKKLARAFFEHDRDSGFAYLQEQFSNAGFKLPVLYKQYASLYEPGGYQLLNFSVDPDFGYCIDGLFLADLTKLKPKKRERYLA